MPKIEYLTFDQVEALTQGPNAADWQTCLPGDMHNEVTGERLYRTYGLTDGDDGWSLAQPEERLTKSETILLLEVMQVALNTDGVPQNLLDPVSELAAKLRAIRDYGVDTGADE